MNTAICDEPEEGDYTSPDGNTWYQFGRMIIDGKDVDPNLVPVETFLRIHAEANNYWPNAWIISDHGNAHLIRY